MDGQTFTGEPISNVIILNIAHSFRVFLRFSKVLLVLNFVFAVTNDYVYVFV